MQRIIPAEYVLTSEAIAEMQQGDAEWLRLKDLRDQSGRQHGAEWTAMGNRAAELQAVLLDNVASDRPPAFIVKPTDTGAWQALSLPRGYWADVAPASVALVKGSVVAGKLHDNDIRRFEGDALCFRRDDWSAWLAVATAKHLADSTIAGCIVTIGQKGRPPKAGRLAMWTVPMCCVWAATRDIEAVAHVELSDPDSGVWLFADDSLPFWQGAHVLAWRSYLLEEAGGTSLPDLGVALLQLQEHAARGTVVVRGLLRDEGKAEAIPADAWANLQIMTWRSLPGFIAGPQHLQPSAYWWSRLRVLPDELIGVWPHASQAEDVESRAAQQVAAHPVVQAPTVLAAPATSPYGRRKRTGIKPDKRDALKDWIRQKFPDGIPADTKNDVVLTDFAAEKNIKASEKTLRRALDELATEAKGKLAAISP
jgi:hypothetical protein